MSKISKTLFRTERIGKIFAIITTIALAFTIIMPSTFAAFWRTIDGTNKFVVTTDEPNVKKYAWGYGDSGWGYGFGYGYNVDNNAGYYMDYDNPDVTLPPGTINGTMATVAGGDPANTTQVTMTQTVEFSPGGGIYAVLPTGLEITQSGGGAFDATDIAAAAGVPPDLGASFSVGGAVDFGITSGGVKLLFSIPVKIVIPVTAPNGTAVNIGVKHAGDAGYTSASLSTDSSAICAGGNATPTNSTAVVAGGVITIYTCAASSFISYSGTGGGGGGGAAVTGGGGGGGMPLHMLLAQKESQVEAVAEALLSAFTDITGHWAKSYIEQVVELGIFQGKSTNRFAPNDPITRAEFTKVALIAFGYDIPSVGTATFADVLMSAWYAPYITAAKNTGLIMGYGDGAFRPNSSINRAEALKILLEAAEFTGIDDNHQMSAAFPDVPMGSWFAKYVTYAKDFGIIGGYSDGTFGPGNVITRAETAKIIIKTLNLK